MCVFVKAQDKQCSVVFCRVLGSTWMASDVCVSVGKMSLFGYPSSENDPSSELSA